MTTSLWRIVVVLGLLGTSASMVGRDHDPHDGRIRNLSQNDGLSSSKVSCILKDKKGYMWFGTSNGLNRYDGNSIFVYHPSGPTDSSYHESRIVCLYQDKTENLWVGTTKGLYLFDYDLQKLKRVDPAYKTRKEVVVTSMTEDKAGNLWIATSGHGLNRYSPESRSYSSYDQLFGAKSFAEHAINKLFCDSHGELWIGTWDDGLYRMKTETGEIAKYSASTSDASPSVLINRISDIREGPDKSLWVGTWGHGLVCIDPDRKKTSTFTHDHQNPSSLNGNKIKSLVFDQKGYLWIGTEETGLDRFAPEKGEFIHYLSDFVTTDVYEGVSVYSMFIDDQSLLWLGFRNDGVMIVPLKSSLFRHHIRAHEPDYRIFSLCEADDRLWMGIKGGLDVMDLKDGSFKRYPLPDNETPISLYALDDTKLLVGTYVGGISVFDTETQQFSPFLTERHSRLFRNKKINCFYKTPSGNILMGTMAGFFSYDPRQDSLKKISEAWIHTIIASGKGNCWLFPFGSEIYDYYPETGKLQVHTTTLTKGNIKTGALLSDPKIYLGTDLGFYQYDPVDETTKLYHDISPYVNTQVNAMIKDQAGNLWFTANKRVVFFNHKAQRFRIFDEDDALPGIRFRDEVGLRLGNGHIVFGGDGGLIVFDPLAFQPYENQSPLVFSRLALSNETVSPGSGQQILSKDISETSSLVLKHHQNIISLEFSLLSYINPDRHSYRYRLEGLTDQWFEIGHQNSLTFTNLHSGDYRLHIQAANQDGNLGQVKVLNISVLPPPWRTWYAYLAYVIAALGIMLVIKKINNYKVRLKHRIKLEHMKLESIEQSAHHKSQFYQMRMRFFTNISHEFRTPLTLILGPLEKFVRKNVMPSRSHLRLMYKNADRLRRLIDQILDFRKMEADNLKFKPSWGDIILFTQDAARLFHPMARQKGLELHIRSNAGHQFGWFDRDKLEKIVFNLLSNACKYTHKGSVSFSVNILDQDDSSLLGKIKFITESDCAVEILVEDTGIGIPSDQCESIFDRFHQIHSQKLNNNGGTGIGLTLTREMVKVHKGVITLSSNLNRGSVFRVVLPLSTQENQIVVDEQAGSDLPRPELQATDAPVISPDEQQPLVLVIEDNKDLREYLQVEFDGKFKLLEADNGKTGFAVAMDKIPDLIISDIMMPEMDGIELCEALKSEEKTSHIPIILLTAHGSLALTKEALKMGADDFVTKPFSSELLLARINNLLHSRKKMQRKYSREVRLQPHDLPITSMDEAFLNKAMEVVEANMDNSEFSADFFASEMCMSRVHLYRKLKALTNQSVSDFVKTTRLKLASNLIKHNKLTIKEAAYTVGFKDPKYFSKCFKQQFGVIPSEYHGDNVVEE